MSTSPELQAEGDGGRLFSFHPERIARALPAFEILREIGKGSMGIVFEARRRSDGLRVALKVLPPSLQENERSSHRFQREGRLMARIDDPHIVTVHEFGEAEGLRYFAMDLVEGIDLEQRLEIGPLPIAQAVELGRQVAYALQAAHDHGVVHRDIKPGNLILREDGTVAITDFGLAREERGGSMTESGAIVGTPMFMAPEQVRGQHELVGVRSDVYGLGATLYTLLTGQPPFSGPGAQRVLRQVLEEEPPRPRSLRAEIPGALEAVLWKAMAREPRLRYGSARELGEDLERFARGEPVQARIPGLGQRTVDWARKRPGLAVAGMLCLLLAGFLWQQSSESQRNALEASLAMGEQALASALAARDVDGRPITGSRRNGLLLRATRQAESALEIDPEEPRGLLLRARARLALGDAEAALTDLDRVAGLLPEVTSELLHLRIETLTRQGGSADGRLQRDLYSLLDLDPGPGSRAVVAQQLLDLAQRTAPGARGDILALCGEILDPVPEGADAMAAIARSRHLALTGDVPKAQRTLERACERFAGNLLVHSEAARLYRQLGMEDRAMAEEQRARLLDPEFRLPAVDPQTQGEDAIDMGEVRDFLQDLERLVRTIESAGKD